MSTSLEVDSMPVLGPKKRWRKAYATLYSTRALVYAATKSSSSVLKKIVSRNQSDLYSQIEIDIPEESSSEISPSVLAELAREKNFDELQKLGGIDGLISTLKTDAEKGLQGKDINSRCKAYGSNTFQRPSMKTIHILLESFKDPIMIVLLVCATLSFGFGIPKHGLHGCLDGVSIFAAVFLFITVSSLSKYLPIRQLYELSKTTHSMNITAIRDGKCESIPISDVVVGDLLSLGVGDRVPADGLYITGTHSLLVDESHIRNENFPVIVQKSNNPFLHYGSKVIKGNGQMLVTGVGKNTLWAQTNSGSSERTPLQKELHRLTSIIAKSGYVVAFLVLTILIIRYFMGSLHDDSGSIGRSMIGILVTPITIASSAIPEGLLLAAAITIACTINRMADRNVTVRNLSACEVISSATVIVTNKRGILEMNKSKVGQCFIGSTDIEELGFSSIAPEVLYLLREGIAHADTYLPEVPSEITNQEIQQATELWCRDKMEVYAEASSSEQHGRIMSQRTGNTTHLYQKGAPEKILPMCSNYYEKNGIPKRIGDEKEKLEKIIYGMRLKGFHCIAFAFKDTLLAFVGLKSPFQCDTRKAVMECKKAGVTIQMITEDDIHTAWKSAIECSIIDLNQCTNVEEVVEAAKFLDYSNEERLEKVEKIRVFARASTIDKFEIVKCLKQKGHVVVLTGQSEGGARELREANLQLSLGIQRANESSDANVLILDDNFASVPGVIRWGRVMYNNIQIFTQFQLTASIASLVVDFVITISASKPPTINIVAAISAGKVPYAALQILWVKLIIGTLAALALTTDKYAEKLMEQPPVNHNKSFITNIMWRNIVGQAMYQIIVLLTVQFTGESTFNLSPKRKDTLIFNIFVLCQLFSIFNAKNYERSTFSGLHRNRLFWGVVGTIILLQVMILEMLKRFADTERLSLLQWKACIGIAFLSWPIGWLINPFPGIIS